MNISRRRFGGHITGAAVGATLAACGAEGANAPADSPLGKRALILVHGSWFGSWCYAALIPLLAAKGITVVAPDLPGHGLGARFPASFGPAVFDANGFSSEGSPLAGVSLQDYVSAILAQVNSLSSAGYGPITVLGHSMAGIPITAAAEQAPSRIAKLIYLSAFMPVTSAPAVAYLQRPEASDSKVGELLAVPDPTAIGALRLATNSSDPAYTQKLKNAFCADVSDLDFAAIAHLMQPDDPAQAYGTPTGATAKNWGTVPRAYIGCTGDHTVPPALQKLFVSEADTLTPSNKTDFRTFDSSHTPFFAKASTLADLLATLIA